MPIPTVAAAVLPADFPDRETFDVALMQAVASARPQLIVCAGFMRIISAAGIRAAPCPMINIHPSLLPKFPGLHTHARAIEAGDTEAGCSVHEVTAVLDDGPILGQARVPVLANDSESDLAARVLVQEHLLYPAVLKRFLAGERGRIDLVA